MDNLCKYTIKVGGKTFVLFEGDKDINTLDKLKDKLIEAIKLNGVEEYRNLLEQLVDSENEDSLDIDDINTNTVGTYTPTELVKSFALNEEERNLYKNGLNINNWNKTSIVPGYGDETIKTQYKDGNIYLNLNYINSKFNNIIALTEMAIADTFGEEWFKENDFSKIVNDNNNDFDKVNEILSEIIKDDKYYDKLSDIILTAYYKNNIVSEVGSNNINTERENLENTWNKHHKSSVERRGTHSPYQKINITDLKAGDYILIPNKAKLENSRVKDWGEIFYDFYIDENNEYVIRTVGKNEKDGTYFLRKREALLYAYDSTNKRKYIKKGNSVEASIEMTESFTDYKYDDKNKTVTIPIKSGNRALDYNSQLYLFKNKSARVKLTKNAEKSHKILSLNGRTVTLNSKYNGEQRQIIIGDPTSFAAIEIDAPVINTDRSSYQDGYKTPSIGEGIIVKIDDDTEIFGKVVGKDFERTNSFLYVYQDGDEYKVKSAMVSKITAVEKPASTNENVRSLDETALVETLTKIKFGRIDMSKQNASVEGAILENIGEKNLNLKGLTYSISDIDKYTPIKKGDLLYQNGTVHKVIDNVTITSNDGTQEFYVKTIYRNNLGVLAYLNINRNLLNNYVLLTENLNETFARQSLKKNMYELFPNKSGEKTYIESKVYKKLNGFIYSLPSSANLSESYLYEDTDVDITDEYKEVLQKRYKWDSIPEALYAVEIENPNTGNKTYKKDSMNTTYIKFNRASLDKLISEGNLKFIVPGSFISIKGDADAYIVEKVLKDKLLVSKYVYTKFENKKLPNDLRYVKSESFFMRPSSKIELQGIHLPKWATESYKVLSKHRVDHIKKSVSNDTIYSDSKEIIAELSKFLEEKFNVKIHLITNNDLASFNNPNISNARAFTDGNEVYVNIDKASVAEPLHELLHLVMATMKANDPDTYYTLVRSIENHKMFNEVSKNYNDINTELLEETFIQLFSRTFRRNILTSGIFSESIFHEAIRKTVKDMFSLTKSLEWEDAQTLMKKEVNSILDEFGSTLISNPESLVDNSSVYMMFEIAGTIKNLVDSGNLEQICY